MESLSRGAEMVIITAKTTPLNINTIINKYMGWWLGVHILLAILYILDKCQYTNNSEGMLCYWPLIICPELDIDQVYCGLLPNSIV